ncbi:metal-dependent hydrolase [Halorussus salinus]|uniref:metal-dependent hydrolase n=1 Tax=Halorussus salinus TaxID=1364935 RepID=UPI001092C160|nr:metal-dependent hydrolase [Halorussus salinus]
MHREGHIGVGLLIYSILALPLVLAGFRKLALVGGFAVVGLAMLPDQDQRVPGIKHRGITHTVWFALLIGLLFAAAGLLVGLQAGLLSAVGLTVYGFMLGCTVILSHIAGDVITPMGVKPFAPVSNQKYTYSVAKAANPIANYLLLALGGAASLGVLALGTAV